MGWKSPMSLPLGCQGQRRGGIATAPTYLLQAVKQFPVALGSLSLLFKWQGTGQCDLKV